VNAIANGLIAAFGPEGDDWGQKNLQAVAERYTLKTQGERLGMALADMINRSA
jgi:hypothetical protein